MMENVYSTILLSYSFKMKNYQFTRALQTVSLKLFEELFWNVAGTNLGGTMYNCIQHHVKTLRAIFRIFTHFITSGNVS